MVCVRFFFQAEDGIRDVVRSRGLGDVYKRQVVGIITILVYLILVPLLVFFFLKDKDLILSWFMGCLLYTSDAADERSSVDLGGRRIIKKKKHTVERYRCIIKINIYTSRKEQTNHKVRL